ncbi:MAG TPA: branched-chain amino acid ABC transporter substrate-binding protein [Verrucomicrobiae bacterium]|nr:branched-chain amino acid ABC transporter substrate-binding protein [Verrucomicrobiae bacterium]
MNRRRFLAAAAAGAAATAAPAAAQIYNPSQPQQFLQQLTIAVNVTLSGPFGKYGAEVVKGVQAAVDETNRFNPPISRVFGIRAYDDRNTVPIAATNADIAAADPSTIGIVGNLTAPMTLAALSRYANVNFAVVVPTVTADSITKRGYHNVFRLPASDTASGRLFASSALQGKRGVAALAISFDGDYGYDVARAFATQAKAQHNPSDVLLFPKGKTDPAAAARTVLDSAPQYVFLAGKTAELGPVAQALRTAGYTGEFGASDGFYNAETITSYGKALDGALVASPMPPLERIPSMAMYLTDFEHEAGQITAFSAYGYAAAQVLIAASERTNATTRFSVLTTMQQGGTFQTLVGNFTFNINGDPLIPDIYLYRVGTSGFTYVRPAIRSGFII